MLNTNDLQSNCLKPEQYEWLEKELAENYCKWTVISIHNPMYSVGKYGAEEGRNGVALALREQLGDLFAIYGVDLVLQGHDHVISRTVPIDVGGVPKAENIEIIDGVEYSVNPDGVIYIMNGPAGSQARSPYKVDQALYEYARNSFAASWAEIEVSENLLKVTVKWHDGTKVNVYNTWGIKKD